LLPSRSWSWPVAPAGAQLTIEIVGGAGTTVPIAIVPFENESTWPLGISGVVAADLQRSGLFRQVSDAGIVPRPSRAEDVKFADFPRARRGRRRGRVDAGRCRTAAWKCASPSSTPSSRRNWRASPTRSRQRSFRATAHRIADVIYEKLTGDAGVFSTRIAYITKQGNRFELIVADADGSSNPQSIVGSNEPLLSPAWSPDGARIGVRVAGEQEARRLRAVDGDRTAAGARQFPRQQQRARVVAGWPKARGDASPRTAARRSS
jgi:TolB protein